MLRIRSNKSLLQAELIKDTGQYVMLKVFHNIQTKIAPTSDAETQLADMNKIPRKYDMTLPFFYIVYMV